MLRLLQLSFFAIIGSFVWFGRHHNELPSTVTGAQDREQCSASQTTTPTTTTTTTTTIAGQTPVRKGERVHWGVHSRGRLWVVGFISQQGVEDEKAKLYLVKQLLKKAEDLIKPYISATTAMNVTAGTVTKLEHSGDASDAGSRQWHLGTVLSQFDISFFNSNTSVDVVSQVEELLSIGLGSAQKMYMTEWRDRLILAIIEASGVSLYAIEPKTHRIQRTEGPKGRLSCNFAHVAGGHLVLTCIMADETKHHEELRMVKPTLKKVKVFMLSEKPMTPGRGPLTYRFVHDIDVDSPRYIETWYQNKKTFSVIISGEVIRSFNDQHVHFTRHTTSALYCWIGNHFDNWELLPGNNPVAAHHFMVNEFHYLAFANFQNNKGQHNCHSMIFRYYVDHGRYMPFQTVETRGACHLQSFTVGSKRFQHTFLAIANFCEDTNTGVCNPDTISTIYHFEEGKFKLFQEIETSHAFQWMAVQVNMTVLLALVSKKGVTFYQYNGWRFVTTAVQPSRPPFSVGVTSLASAFWDGRLEAYYQLKESCEGLRRQAYGRELAELVQQVTITPRTTEPHNFSRRVTIKGNLKVESASQASEAFSQGRRIPNSGGQIEARIGALEGTIEETRRRLNTLLPAAGPVAWPAHLHLANLSSADTQVCSVGELKAVWINGQRAPVLRNTVPLHAATRLGNIAMEYIEFKSLHSNILNVAVVNDIALDKLLSNLITRRANVTITGDHQMREFEAPSMTIEGRLNAVRVPAQVFLNGSHHSYTVALASFSHVRATYVSILQNLNSITVTEGDLDVLKLSGYQIVTAPKSFTSLQLLEQNARRSRSANTRHRRWSIGTCGSLKNRRPRTAIARIEALLLALRGVAAAQDLLSFLTESVCGVQKDDEPLTLKCTRAALLTLRVTQRIARYPVLGSGMSQLSETQRMTFLKGAVQHDLGRLVEFLSNEEGLLPAVRAALPCGMVSLRRVIDNEQDLLKMLEQYEKELAKSVTYGYNRTISIPNKTSISSEDAVPATPPDTHPKTDKPGHREDSHGSWVVGRVAGHRLQDLIDRSFAHLPTRREAAFFIVNNMARLNNITFKSGLRVQQLQGVDTGHLLRHGMPIRSSTIHANITFTIPVEVDGPMRVSRVNGALAASFVTLGGHHTLPHSFLFMGPVTAAARIRVRNEINGLDLVLFSKSVALTSSATRQVLRQPITFKQVSVQRLFFGTGRVRDVTLEDLVTLSHPAIITGRKIFQDVKVREGDTRAATLSVHYINDVNVTDLFANSLTTNPETKQVVYGPIIFMNLMVMGKLITSNGLGVHSNSGMQSLHIKRIAARMLYRDKDGQLASNLLLKGRASVKDLAFRDSLDSVTASFYDGGWLLKTTPQSFSGRVILAHVTSGAATVASGAKIQEVDISRLLTATIKLNENAAVAFPVKLSGNMWAARAWVGGAVQGWNLTSEVILQNSSDVVFMAHKTFSDDFHVSGALTAASLRGMAASSLCGENSQKNFDILGAVQLKNPVRTDSVYLGQHVVTKGTVDDYWLLNQHVVLPQNITFYKVKANHIKADSVNGVDVAKLSAVLLRRTCKSGNRQMMTGSFFAPLLVVHSLFTPGISTSSLNSRPLSDINNLFTRDGQQTIKGHWTLQQVQNLESLVTFGHTNGIQMTDFCMIQKPCIITARKIFAHDLTIKKDLHVEPGRTVQGVDVSEAFNQAINGTTCGHVPGVTTFNGSLTASRLTVNGLVNGFKVSSKDVLTGSGAQVMSGQMNITKGMVHELWGWRSVQTLRSTIARLVPLWMMDGSDGVLSSCPEYMAVISGSGNTKLLIYSYDQRKFINTGMVLRGSCTRAVAGYKTRGENYVITAHTCTSNRSHSTSTTIGSFHQGTAIQEAVQVWRITTHGPQHFQRIGTGALDVQVAEVGQRICLVVAAAIGNGTLVYCSRGSRNTFSGSQHLETGCPKKISVVLHRDSRGRLVTLLAVVGQDRNALHDSALTLWVHDAEQDNFIQVEASGRAPLRGVQWVDMIVHGADLFLAVASRGFTGDTTGKVIVYWVNLHGDLLPLQYFGSLRKTFQTAATPEKLYSPRPQPLLHRLQTLAVQLPLETHFVAMPSGPLYLFVMSEQGNVTRFAQKGVHRQVIINQPGGRMSELYVNFFRFAMEGLYHAPGRQQVQVWLCEEKDGEVSIKMAMSGSQCRQEQCSGPGHMDVELLEANFKPGPPSIH
ncbi:Thrombospondin-type laminin G domain and EAR repeat-containing protein [Portunus trituberculatus]|uniref:Thrombospondin-type laminin G domain and EAR repeat-containing protein n=1 Tax=Portunus trituberculatus TaxID=210409 RepID=A0A5B7D2I4_PORTR|nr:Thrombospondin-type laminin G domain and EAR repeat-containing protein [Portunus trituberculatus]